VLIANKPPAVNADTHDHGARRPNTSDATLVQTPIASSASATGESCSSGPSSAPSSARAHRKKCAATVSAQERNRDRQSRTVSAGTPSRSATRRYPSPASNASPITSTASFRPARYTSGSSTCVARHARSRQRPRRGRSRRSPSRVRSTRSREQPQPPNTPTRQRGHTNRPAARSASTTTRSSETMSTTSSNGVTAPSSHTPSRHRRGGLNQQDHHHPVARGTPPPPAITNQRDAEPPRRHHPACRSTDREVFEHVRARLGVRSDRVLFLDDNITNVEAGRDAGFLAVQVAGVDNARRALVEAKVIGSPQRHSAA